MKKIILSTSILFTVLFTGCSSHNPNLPMPDAKVVTANPSVPYSGETKFENIEGSDTLVKVTHSLKGKHQSTYKVIVPAINKVNEEVKKRGYEYFQIVSPTQISNLAGFPINNKSDLVAFLNPQATMPVHSLNLLETRRTLMDNQEGQDVVDLPFLIFGTTEFEFIIRLVKEPQFDEIVWNVNN